MLCRRTKRERQVADKEMMIHNLHNNLRLQMIQGWNRVEKHLTCCVSIQVDQGSKQYQVPHMKGWNFNIEFKEIHLDLQ